jgi:pimeloyl-ACP methyl ester carboxylesterase
MARRNVLKPFVRTTLLTLVAASLACQPQDDSLGETQERSETSVQSTVATTEQELLTSPNGRLVEFSRKPIAGDVFRYNYLLRIGKNPNALLRISRIVRERAPFVPRATPSSIMLLHGDFATFTTNFAPLPGPPARSDAPQGGLAVYLANRNIDVWGVDRRWTNAPTEGADVSDFTGMNFAQELSDIRAALGFARLTRGVNGAGFGTLLLGGFSRGGQLAYEYAASETQLPQSARQMKGLVAIDVYAKIAPVDEQFRVNACQNALFEREAFAAGTIDSDNGFQIQAATLAASQPNEMSPFFPGVTNRQALFEFMARTFEFFQPTLVYHLAAASFNGVEPTNFRFTSEPVIQRWLMSAPFHQALPESLDGDSIWCNEGPRPVPDHLSSISVPLFYLGAAGGFGDHGLYSTTLVASNDVTTQVVRRLAPSLEAEDFGHGDLLYANDAPTLAWWPLARWIVAH